MLTHSQHLQAKQLSFQRIEEEMAFQGFHAGNVLCMFCRQHIKTFYPAALPNCVNALTGPQPLEQAASGSVNGENAAQPAAHTVAGVDGSASAHAIQVCTTQATIMHCFVDSHACMCLFTLHVPCFLMPLSFVWSFKVRSTWHLCIASTLINSNHTVH